MNSTAFLLILYISSFVICRFRTFCHISTWKNGWKIRGFLVDNMHRRLPRREGKYQIFQIKFSWPNNLAIQHYCLPPYNQISRNLLWTDIAADPFRNAVSKAFRNIFDYLFVELFVANDVKILEEMQHRRRMFYQICIETGGRRLCVKFWVHHFEQGYGPRAKKF